MPGDREAPAIRLDDAAETTDTYVFGTGDTDGDTSTADDTSLSGFYDVFMTLNNRTELVAPLNADGANGSLSIGSTDAPSTVDFDEVVDPDGTSDAFFL